jgi:hypothetical protein
LRHLALFHRVGSQDHQQREAWRGSEACGDVPAHEGCREGTG